MKSLSPERKLKFLQQYMNEWVDRRIEAELVIVHPQRSPLKTFPVWLESTLDSKEHKGKMKSLEQRKRVCRYCKRSFENTYIQKTKDHIVPISKGGHNVKDNRVFACDDCNQWKGDKSLQQWLKEVRKVYKKGKPHNPYTMTLLGMVIGSIITVIDEIKLKRHKISTYRSE